MDFDTPICLDTSMQLGHLVHNFEFWKSSYYLSKNDLIKCWHHMQLQLIKVKCGVKRENQLNVTFNVFK